MHRLHTIGTTLLVSATIALSALAQTPPGTNSQPATPAKPAAKQAATSSNTTRKLPVTRTQAQPRRRSVVHHYPYPYPGYYRNDRTAGWRNPGSVGRYAEYYPPGDQFQINQAGERDPVGVATFGDGGIPDRNEQLRALQIGVQRDNAIQNHIDNYARPYAGYGMGVGYFGGFY